jgi:hypothetical protein
VHGEVLAQAEIGQQKALVGRHHRRCRIAARRDGRTQQDIAGTQVAVHEIGAVDGRHRSRQRAGDHQQVIGARRSPAIAQIDDAGSERPTVRILEREVQLLLRGLPDVVDPHHVRAVDAPQHGGPRR